MAETNAEYAGADEADAPRPYVPPESVRKAARGYRVIRYVESHWSHWFRWGAECDNQRCDSFFGRIRCVKDGRHGRGHYGWAHPDERGNSARWEWE